MRTLIFLVFSVLCNTAFSQDLTKRITTAIEKMHVDSQFRHAIISLYITNDSGKILYAKNEHTGLAPASCQKIITSATAYELLGKNYQYKTTIWYQGEIENGVLDGSVYFKGSGDPTIGSWRYTGLKGNDILKFLGNFLNKAKIKKILYPIGLVSQKFSTQVIPDGWIWQDIGNYYGSGVTSLNWHENQYDIILKAGDREGDPVSIINIIPSYTGLKFMNECVTGKKNSGDNAYIYLPLQNDIGYIRGTIPFGEKNFSISGAVPLPVDFFSAAINYFLQINGYMEKNLHAIKKVTNNNIPRSPVTYFSPSLDSMNYWFLKKSINLYGEALVKTISLEKQHYGSTDSGINIIKNFWSQHGIHRNELKIVDGSGLSPANRITTSALVTILQYAKNKEWFNSFYYSLPVINGIKMKDGYINGVRSYAGYIKNKSGAEYTFCFIVNNFDGSAAIAREKMWAVLDVLK